jgi:transposase-like protein
VTDAVTDDVREWQTRSLEDGYPVVFLDCLVPKIRAGGSVVGKAGYLVLDVRMDGTREVPSIWFKRPRARSSGCRSSQSCATVACPPEVRRVICTTNAIEALNRQLRKTSATNVRFPTEDAARKLIYLAILDGVPQWTRTGLDQITAGVQNHFRDRLPD